MSLAIWRTKGLTCRKPFGVPRRFHKSQALFGNKVLQVASLLGDLGGCTSRKFFGGPGAYKSQSLWGTKALTQVASPLGDQGADKSQALL